MKIVVIFSECRKKTGKGTVTTPYTVQITGVTPYIYKLGVSYN